MGMSIDVGHNGRAVTPVLPNGVDQAVVEGVTPIVVLKSNSSIDSDSCQSEAPHIWVCF